jgi:hypothetical protein
VITWSGTIDRMASSEEGVKERGGSEGKKEVKFTEDGRK